MPNVGTLLENWKKRGGGGGERVSEAQDWDWEIKNIFHVATRGGS